MGGMRNVVLTVLIFLFAAPALALELALPVACSLGTDCWVQQYADHDAGAGSADYACGVASYNGHDGTDIRVLHTGVDVAVLAAATGRVKAVRDGVVDRLVKTEADLAAVAKTECGNGVVITHEDGWETQYCHMRKGSVAVKAGDVVAPGERLGLIGYSGEAAFPHVHVTVRKNGKLVDPFSADDMTDCKAADRSLWSASAQKALAYQASELLLLQWANTAFSEEDFDSGKFPALEALPNETALVANSMAINLYKGDIVSLTVTVPGQEPVASRVVLKRNRALQRLFAGKKRNGDWPRGRYMARFEVVRGDVVVVSREISFEVR
jgi:murein DD-endopeptidase MepM/ murein hydrolase activator NlpD